MPNLLLRYEDMRNRPTATLLDLTSFLLPEEDRPDLEAISCALELDEEAEAYASGKRKIFSTWNQYTPAMRKEIVQVSLVH